MAMLRPGQGLSVHAAGIRAPAAELPGAFNYCRFRPDGKVLAAVGPQACELFDVGAWKAIHKVALEADPKPNLSASDRVPRVAFSADSRFLAVPTAPGVVTLFEAPSYREVARLALSERELHDLEFTPDGAWLLAGATDGSAHLVDLARLRRRLADMALDWDGPRPEPVQVHRPIKPVRIVADLAD
jgi:WD40 repeat protein